MKKINKNIQEEINELNQFFEDMKKSLFKEYSEKDFEEMEKEYILSEKKKERCNYEQPRILDWLYSFNCCVHVFHRNQTAAEGKEKNAGIDGKHRRRRQRFDFQRLLRCDY